MLYDKSFERFKFSTDQYIDQAKVSELHREYADFTKQLLMGDYKKVNTAMYGYEQKGSKASGIIFAVIFISAMAAIIAFALMKNITGVILSFTGIFLFAGIMLLLGKALIAKQSNTSKERLKMRLRGFIITAVCVSIIAIVLNKDKFQGVQMYILLAVILFGAAALWLILFAFVDVFAKMFLYRETVDAKCIGYVRIVDSEGSTNESINVRKRFFYIMTSPVFEYTYNGRQIEALYDDLVVNNNSDVALGTYETIRINPNHPEDIYSPRATKINSAAYVIFGMFAAVAAIAIAILGLSPNANVTYEGPAVSDSGLIVVGDEEIEESYASDINGQDWYIETLVIDTAETEGDYLILRFDDPGMRALRIPADSGYAAGDSIIVLYTIDDEWLDEGVQYKDSFIFINPGEYEYQGNHGAYEG
ncbi:MAG: hypothetical protein K6F79_08355 [Saccharofermentans sp.]|nr:hypothetical protein [Saccharofermentans sp.]